MIETESLQELIDDARKMPVVVPRPRVLDLTQPAPRREIRIPEAVVVELEDYELYIG